MWLAIDTCLDGCSVALGTGKGLVSQENKPLGRGHAEAIVPMIESVMGNAKQDFAALETVLVTSGPGTFAGVRVGVAVARALAVANNIPCFGYSLPEIAFEKVSTPCILALKARGDMIATVYLEKDATTRQPVMLSKQQVLSERGPVYRLSDVAGLEKVASISISAENLIFVHAVLGKNRKPSAPNPLYWGPPQATPAQSRFVPGRKSQ